VAWSLSKDDGTLPLNTIAEILGYDVTELTSGRVVITFNGLRRTRDSVLCGCSPPRRQTAWLGW
jgi:hypothetical protein